MNGLPVTVRLLDPPLHEFVPHDEAGQAEMAKVIGVSLAEVKHRVEKLHEFNPMMGHRGCRLGITYPELIRMQMRAIAEAAINVGKRGIKALPEVMVPLIGTVKELAYTKDEMLDELAAVNKEQGTNFTCPIGTMIEIPRAAITADKIADGGRVLLLRHQRPHPDGLRLLPRRLRHLPARVRGQEDPRRRSLPEPRPGRHRRAGPDRLRKGPRHPPRTSSWASAASTAATPARSSSSTAPGLNYVSCSPYRVPIAILAAAQAVLEEKK